MEPPRESPASVAAVAAAAMVVAVAAAAAEASAPRAPALDYRPRSRTALRVTGFHAVANRGGGTVSLVDPDAGAVVNDYELPGGGEPMYLAIPFRTREVWVGDRRHSVLICCCPLRV